MLACLAALVLATVAVYAYLPLRSAMDPPLDYADPQTWRSFWYVVLGQQFQGSFGGLPPLLDIVSGAWDVVVRNLGPLAILVPAGAILGLLRHPRLVVLTGLWFVCSWLFALGYPNAAIERYYLVPLLVAAAWVALAADAGWDAAPGRPRPGADGGRTRPTDGGPGAAGRAPRAGGRVARRDPHGGAGATGRPRTPPTRPTGESGWRRPWQPCPRTRRWSPGGRSRRRSGTGAGWRGAARTSSSWTTATSSTMALARSNVPSTTTSAGGPSTSSASTATCRA